MSCDQRVIREADGCGDHASYRALHRYRLEGHEIVRVPSDAAMRSLVVDRGPAISAWIRPSTSSIQSTFLAAARVLEHAASTSRDPVGSGRSGKRGGRRARTQRLCFAVKLVCWQNVPMKTTLDLPDELVRRIKIEAAQSDRKLKDLVAQLLEAGLRASRDDGAAAALPKPVKRRRGGPLTVDAIEAAIAAGRE